MKNIILLITIFVLLTNCKEKSDINVNKFEHMKVTSLDDINNPLLLEKFNFNEINYSQLYNLNFKKIGVYEIGILDLNESIPQSFSFKGKIKIEILNNEKLLQEEIIESVDIGIYANKEMTLYKRLTFMRLDIPFEREFIDISIRISVLNPDKQFNSDDKIMLYISASSTP